VKDHLSLPYSVKEGFEKELKIVH